MARTWRAVSCSQVRRTAQITCSRLCTSPRRKLTSPATSACPIRAPSPAKKRANSTPFPNIRQCQ
eukprot:scaffold169815_cov32-Tisochrysis_lutea.AAC.1